jgi:hypothetical protein
VTDRPQTSGERPLTPGDPPPPLTSAADQPAQLPPSLPAGQAAFSGVADAIEEKPELAVGGAFAGGLILALILKRLAR